MKPFSFSANFYLKTGKNPDLETPYPIYLRIIVGRKKAEIHSKKTLKPREWDFDKRFPKEMGWVSKALNKMLQRVDNIHSQLVLGEETVTARKIKDIYLGRNAESFLLTEYIEDHIEQMKLQPRTYSKGTIKHYVTLLNHLKNFHLFSKQPIPYLEDVDLAYLTRFRMYLTQVVGLKNENNHKKLRTVLNKAHQLDQISQSPFRLYKFEKSKRHTIVYLTKRELRTIKELEGLTSAVERVRDIFLFSCFTGLRYSEIEQLRTEHLVERNGHYFLEMQIPKTQKFYLAPLLEEALTLIDKYQRIL